MQTRASLLDKGLRRGTNIFLHLCFHALSSSLITTNVATKEEWHDISE